MLTSKKTTDKINVLHLRASEKSGGGPEKTIFKTAARIDTDRFWFGVCYLRKNGTDLSGVAFRYRQKKMHYFEIAGGKFDWRQLRAVAELMRRYNVHILHTHDSKSVVYGVLLKACFPQIKLVTTLHGWVIRRRRSRFYQLLSIMGLKVYDAVVAVSRELERQAKNKGVHRLIRIYNAIDLRDWPHRSHSNPSRIRPFTVGYVGRVSREKGPDQFVRVAQLLSAVDDDIRFQMIGEGPMISAVRQQVAHLGLGGRFVFTGHMPQECMLSVYEKLSVLLSCSHTEGMPNTLLEACACGVPVVSTRVGGIRELIIDGHSGFLVSDGDSTTLARSILSIKHHPKLARRFSRNAKMRVLNYFSFDHRVRVMEGLYESLALKGNI